MNTTMNKYLLLISLTIVLITPSFAGCSCTQHFHNLNITKADSFNWKTHECTSSDSIYIEPEAQTDVVMKRWGQTVQFNTISLSSVNYTIKNHKWQNRKVKLYASGSPKRVLFADAIGKVSFTQAHTDGETRTLTLKATWTFRNVIDWFTKTLKYS
jgi:hypothetical protein